MNNLDLKEIWKSQIAPITDRNDIILKTKQYKKSNLAKLIVVNVVLVVMMIFITWIWIYYQPKMWTTKVGIIAIIFSMLIYVFAYNRLGTFFKEKIDGSNQDFLEELIAIKTRQKFMQDFMLKIYFLMLSSGLCLYMIEYTILMKPIFAILAYGFILIWISLNWFIFRPRIIKKQNQKLDDLIDNFKNIKNQHKNFQTFN